MLLVFGGSQGARSLNELAFESFGPAGPQFFTSPVIATTRSCAAASLAAGLPARPVHARLRRRARASRRRALPGGRVRVRPRRCREARRARSLSGTRPPTTRRRTPATSSRRAPRSSSRTPSSTACPSSCSRSSPIHRDCVRWGEDARSRPASRGGRDRGGADRACDLSRVAGSGSSVSAAPA